jgi:hypothetical protein
MNQLKTSECSCDVCKNMCRRTPCLPTPEDVVKLMAAGHKSKLRATIYAGPFTDVPVRLVAPHYDEERKACAFLDDNNLCILHESGLKPLEGKLANHANEYEQVKNNIQYILNLWNPKTL